MGTFVSALDLIALFAALAALVILWSGWKRVLRFDLTLILAGVLTLTIFHDFSNVLEWSNITSVLDPFKDYLEVLLPMLWGFFFYTVLRGIAEETLRRSERRFRAIFDQTYQFIGLTTPDGTLIEANRTALDVFGIEESDVLNRPFWEAPWWAHSSEQQDRLRDAMARAAAGELVRFEAWHPAPDGSIRYVDCSIKPVRDEAGNVYLLIPEGRDITDRKRTEEALEARARQQAAVVELGHYALAGGDLDELMDETVKRLATTLEVEYSKVLELLPDGKALLLRAGVGWQNGLVGRGTVEAGQDSQAGYTLLSKQPVVCEDLSTESRFFGARLLLDHGVVSGMTTIIEDREGPWGILGVHTTQRRVFSKDDVNFLRVAANVLANAIDRKRAEEALRESEERFRNLFDGISDGVAVYEAVDNGADFVFLGYNPAGQKMDGASKEDAVGRRVTEVFSGVEKMGLLDVLRRVWKTGIPDDHPVSVYEDERVTFWRKNSVYKLPSGEIVVVYSDETARRRAEEERERLIAELESKNAELERFTYTVSHDLRSPLVTISGFLGVLKQDAMAGNAEAMEEDVTFISKAAGKMEQLLDELLDLSRIGRRDNPAEEIALADLAQEVVSMTLGKLGDRGIRVEISADLPIVFGDRLRLWEVLQNLVDNAASFMGDQPRPRIEIGSRRDREETVCYIRDNGMGIDPAYHEKVFGLFDRLDPKGEGTGVGLAIVKRIVEVHGGRIWVESEGLGQGATFCFTIPPKRGGES